MCVYMNELPDCCENCPCNDDCYRCGLTGEIFDKHDIDGGRMTNCKLKLLSDVRENVKGEWISESLACTNGGTYRVVRCNKCYESQLLESNFCPNCGAEMKGDNK